MQTSTGQPFPTWSGGVEALKIGSIAPGNDGVATVTFAESGYGTVELQIGELFENVMSGREMHGDIPIAGRFYLAVDAEGRKSIVPAARFEAQFTRVV